MSKLVDKDRPTGIYPDFQEIDHTADYALRIRGIDLRTLFVNAALGLYSLIGPEKQKSVTGAQGEESIALSATDTESLLVEWLSELSYWVESSLFVGTEFDFSALSGTGLIGEVKGLQARKVEKLIKAVTYHDLEVTETETGLEAVVVFDV